MPYILVVVVVVVYVVVSRRSRSYGVSHPGPPPSQFVARRIALFLPPTPPTLFMGGISLTHSIYSGG